MHAFKIISRQDVNFGMLLKAVYDCTGKQVSEYSDNSRLKMSNSQKLGTCLASLVGGDPADILPNIQEHLYFSGLAVFEMSICNDILSAGTSLKWIGVETKTSGGLIGLLTGNLNQWRDSVLSGLGNHNDDRVTVFYSTVLREFRAQGYSDLWKGYTFTEDRGVILIEDKR